MIGGGGGAVGGEAGGEGEVGGKAGGGSGAVVGRGGEVGKGCAGNEVGGGGICMWTCKFLSCGIKTNCVGGSSLRSAFPLTKRVEGLKVAPSLRGLSPGAPAGGQSISET